MGRPPTTRGEGKSSITGRQRAALGLTAAVGLVALAVMLVGQSASAQAALPTLSILDTNTPEGGPEGVDHAVAVPVVLSAPSTALVTVDWQTADGTAEGGPAPESDGPDYYSGNGTLTFAPGETSKVIEIRIDGGEGPEPDETFTVELLNPTNATIARPVATVTILNDDVPPPPDEGEVNVIPTGGGGQCVALWKESGCRRLEFGEQLPIDEIKYINPRSSRVTIRSIVGIGVFYGGQFTVKEFANVGSRTTSAATAKPVLTVGLRGGNFKPCKRGSRFLSSAGAAEAKKKPIRRLWGKGKGRFRTRGRYASGTVRGTNWVTEDYCDGTRIRVVAGVVRIYDLVRKRWVVLKPGESYFSPAKKSAKPTTKTSKKP